MPLAPILIDLQPIRGILYDGEQNSNFGVAVVPLYAARISDLGPGDFVSTKCIACGHDMLIPPSSLLHGLRLPPSTLILDLEPRLRCRECDARGKAVVSIRWAAA